MESVGRLAGGVAHNFNNMLSVIIGYTEMALEGLDPSTPLYADLEEVLDAANRSAAMTRQLLAFARKQKINPKVLDLNMTVESLLKMLRRLLGENLDLFWRPGVGLWPVYMDPSQVDQILANLCVNARDAITDVGKVTIETDNVSIDEAYCAAHAGFIIPGAFVLLAVSDDGCGMPPEIIDNIFDPFFTTKKAGDGTGLGLATVYGIVKQNKGFINVYSEPGKGSTIRIYLPRHQGEDEPGAEPEVTTVPVGQGETVLLVEDEVSILKLVKAILERLNYRVLAAETTDQALNLAERHAGEISLLITDVVMPVMNGRDLAEQLRRQYPAMKAMFMSGYSANVIVHRSLLDQGVIFIQKPFSNRNLAIKVREALNG
ncbi:MAG TPA: response regulator [Proteobacteria bacterium]|nr:response regulator [Pseudomonadota bacterium]